MKVVALRARAKCQDCESKLPPRTEVFWEEETGIATCLTCGRAAGLKETASPPEVPAAVAPPLATEPAAEPLAEPLPEPLAEPIVRPGPSGFDVPLTFEPPSPEKTRPLRPPLAAPAGVRPPLQATRDQRPPLAGVGDRRPPLAVESQPPLPPRQPTSPVLPRRNPAGGPAAPSAPLDQASSEERQTGSVADADPDVDDEPQWSEPSPPLAPPAPSTPAEDHSRHVRASAGLIGRLRDVAQDQDAGSLVDGDVLVDDVPLHDGVERGDPGDSVVGQALEAARSSGIEVLHHLAVGPGERIDQLVVAVNGLWVIRSEDALTGLLERRDLGDWFTADPRLFVGDTDRSELVNDARDRAGTLRRFLATTSYADIPVRSVVTFGAVPAGWVDEPFSLAGVSVVWGGGLVEPMLDPVLIDEVARARLVQLLVDAARLH